MFCSLPEADRLRFSSLSARRAWLQRKPESPTRTYSAPNSRALSSRFYPADEPHRSHRQMGCVSRRIPQSSSSRHPEGLEVRGGGISPRARSRVPASSSSKQNQPQTDTQSNHRRRRPDQTPSRSDWRTAHLLGISARDPTEWQLDLRLTHSEGGRQRRGQVRPEKPTYC